MKISMNEFKALRDLPEKLITGDLVFVQTSNPSIFRSEVTINANGFDVVLNATYYEWKPSLVFNFRIVGNGAICRYCVNHTLHKDAVSSRPVRTHKHTPQSERCFENNLPTANERTDLSVSKFADVEVVWAIICKDANIKHLGKVVKQ